MKPRSAGHLQRWASSVNRHRLKAAPLTFLGVAVKASEAFLVALGLGRFIYCALQVLVGFLGGSQKLVIAQVVHVLLNVHVLFLSGPRPN
jgi:hypothetical protein